MTGGDPMLDHHAHEHAHQHVCQCGGDGKPAMPAMPAPPPAEDLRAQMMDDVVAMLKRCYDPEIPVDIWELGLIYRVDIDKEYNVVVDMTLTSPACPVAGELPLQVQDAVRAVDMVNSCKVELVWEPPWTPEMMSEVAKVQLDMF
jgi:FeS assembly SUF system protein